MTYYRGGLGIDPLTAIATAKTVNTLYEQSKGLWDQHPKDKARLMANMQAAEAALNGSAGALAFLHQRTGQHPAAVVDFSPAAMPHDLTQPISGWATDVAKADAATKEQQVMAALTGGSVDGIAAGFDSPAMVALAAGALMFALWKPGRRR